MVHYTLNSIHNAVVELDTDMFRRQIQDCLALQLASTIRDAYTGDAAPEAESLIVNGVRRNCYAYAIIGDDLGPSFVWMQFFIDIDDEFWCGNTWEQRCLVGIENDQPQQKLYIFDEGVSETSQDSESVMDTLVAILTA